MSKHIPRKRFGQNFLQDEGVIQLILQSLHLKSADNVLEIGPGLGALTRPLLSRLTQLTAIEIDRELQTSLRALGDHLNLIEGDALAVDYHQFGQGLRIIGNLPYNISTPLILHLLHFHDDIKDMHVMLQKEVAERIAAQPGGKQYGRLSIMVQYYCAVDYLFDVPPEAFFPKPKVDSAVIRISPYSVSPYPHVPFSALETCVAKAFSMRRKTLTNNFKGLISNEKWLELGIDPSQRPEQIALSDYIKIASVFLLPPGEGARQGG